MQKKKNSKNSFLYVFMVNIVSVFGKFMFLLSVYTFWHVSILSQAYDISDAPLSGFHVNHMLVVK